jgi:cytoskeletal protein CcmA (bactofilin family)
MAQVYTVTASTSVVLISTITAPNTIVLLGSIPYSGHIVGIRDTTGSSAITNYPVIVSTVSSVSFYDGTSSILLNQPNAFVSLSSKDSSTWQLLNSVGFLNTLSNGFLHNLTAQTGYVTSMNVLQESISSVVAQKVTVLSSITVLGTANIQGDITITGGLTVNSSLRAYESVSLSSGLVVGGAVSFPSSLLVTGTLQVGSNLSTLQLLRLRDELVIDKNLSVTGALLPRNISVQTLVVDTLQTGGGLQIAGGLSTVNASVSKDVVVLGKGVFQSSLTVNGLLSVYDSLTVDGSLTTTTLQVSQGAAVGSYVTANQLTASGSVSTLDGLEVSRQFVGSNGGLVEGSLNVYSTTQIRDLTVVGQALISSMAIYGTLQSQGDASSWSSTFVTSETLTVRNTLAIGQGLIAPSASVSLQDTLSTLTNLSVYDHLVVQGGLYTRQDSYVGGSVLGASTLTVYGNVSTTSLAVEGELYVDGSLFVGQFASASTLGAPISLSISTLTLSNTLTVDSYGFIPELTTNGYADRMAAGSVSDPEFYDVYVGGILQNRASVEQTFLQDYSKLWYANTLRTSTLAGLSNLSTAVIGPTTFTYPQTQTFGVLVVGSNTSGGVNTYYASNASTIFNPTSGSFSVRGAKIANNGSNFWVAVGIGATATDSIQFSADGFNWTSIGARGFPAGGRGIAYGGGQWVAVGSMGGPSANTTVQYSGNGVLWSNCTGATFSAATGSGSGIAYNGSNLWVAVGTDLGLVGIKSSSNGVNWTTATLLPPLPVNFVSVGYGGGVWLASDGVQYTYRSVNGSIWSIVPPATPRLAYAYTGQYWLGGGTAISGNPTTTIQLSPNGSNWININTGGFTGACYDILTNPGQSTFIAVGADSVPTQTILQYSMTGSNWIQTPVYFGAGYGVGVGTLGIPLFQPLFTANVTSIFRSNVSSAILYASSIIASSINGTYTADGQNLSRVGTYTSSIRTSSILATTVRTAAISTNLFTTSFATASDTINVNRNTFFSSANLFLAVGSDSQSNGNIQTSVDAFAWRRALDTNFQYYGNAVTGNSNEANPIFLAAGADSRTAYTLQTSVNGRVWLPAVTGGFSYATPTGVREGTGVAYSSNLNTWVAVGKSIGDTNTIQYSSDGSNWSLATGGFTNYGTTVKSQADRFVAFGNGARWSSDGINWSPSAPEPALTAIGYGTVTSGPTTVPAWIGIAGTTVYTSINEGVSWSLTGNTTVAPVSDVAYNNGRWIAVGSNIIQISFTGLSWAPVTTSFSPTITFYSIAYNSNTGVWVAGGRSSQNTETLWRSTDALTWTQATSGGFSTSVDSYGIGYGVFSLATSTIAVGKSAVDIITNVLPSILLLSTNFGAPGSTITTPSLTASNASNVFSTTVRGIWGTTEEFYKFVAVGDGVTPQKTIGRSIDATPGSWLPAITGGFSTTGYGVTYYNNNWYAVGDSQTSTNVIQYSPDGANWFGTNTAPGIRAGGRGIAAGIDTLGSLLVAVGKDTTTSSIVYSGNGSQWSNTTGAYFNSQGNGVAAGSNGSGASFVAVGADTRGSTYTILRSSDAISWTTASSGGFNIAGYGAAYNKDLARWVAVGADTDTSKTIQYSLDGGVNFVSATNPFTAAGYGVSYNSSIGIFFAVGQDVNGDSAQTIKYSGDGVTWENFSTNSGFVSQKSLGTASGLFTQPILTKETTPYMEFSNLIVYERTEPFLYTKPTIRLQSTFIGFSESLFMNTSSQVVVGSNVPIGIADVSVYGTTYTSSFIFSGTVILPSTLFVSSMVVSTLSSIGSIEAKSLTTPSLGINSSESKANTMTTIGRPGYTQLAINNTLFVPNQAVLYPQFIGIGTSNPSYEVDVQGSFGASTLSTTYVYAPQNIYVSSSRVYFQDDYFSVFEGTNPSLVTEYNRIQTNPSSMTINSIFTLQVSTQRIGLYTTNPQVDFDCQRAGYLGSLRTNTLNTSLLFLTLQSV